MIKITGNENVKFNNNVDFCVGTGRTGLALQGEYMKQLKMVQEEIGFKHIRGHGLFSDDVAIYHEYEEDGVKKVEYNYTYIDRIFDDYLSLGIKPFLELGFMPYAMASGTQTIFYWKGNTTPPADYTKWNDMVTGLLSHLLDRYGDDVLTWPIEVWNEPNLPGFWENADMEKYFELFKESFTAIKKLDARFTVGGPAICGVKEDIWLRGFCDFCRKENLLPDFFTRHHYTIEMPERIGHYDYSKLMVPEDGFNNMKASREIIDSYEEFKGRPMHITEFNTSYTPRGVIHDTNLNAACLAKQLSRIGDVNESYSYWTFGDVFEEQGVQFTPFHGGFGLVADGCIRKPTFWTFAFYKKLQDQEVKCVYRDENAVVVKTKNGYSGVVWNLENETNTETFALNVDSNEFTLIKRTVDEDTCNPLKVWHDLGEPANPSKAELKLLKESDSPLITSSRVIAKDNEATVDVCVKPNGVVMFELFASVVKPDRGYDYEKAVTFR